MIVRHRYPTNTILRSRSGGLDRSFDEVFDQLTSSMFDARRQSGPYVQGAWTDDEYLITVDLPGVPAEAVGVEVTGTNLTLSAVTDSIEWQRSLRLGGRLDPDKVHAQHVDGRLTVRIGTFDQPEPRRVEIDTKPAAAAAIEATAEASTDDTAENHG